MFLNINNVRRGKERLGEKPSRQQTEILIILLGITSILDWKLVVWKWLKLTWFTLDRLALKWITLFWIAFFSAFFITLAEWRYGRVNEWNLFFSQNVSLKKSLKETIEKDQQIGKSYKWILTNELYECRSLYKRKRYETRCQFHQHCTSIFCARRSRKRKNYN